ncbi:LOW QUALITY PROTEIN: leucine-rich repeat-containing protein 9 [Aegotheles albertisi]
MLPARRPPVSGSQAGAGATEKAAVATEGWVVLRMRWSLAGCGDSEPLVPPLVLYLHWRLLRRCILRCDNKAKLYCNEITRIEIQETLTKLNVFWSNNYLIKNIEMGSFYQLEHELAKLQMLSKTSSNKSLRSKNLETENSVHDNEEKTCLVKAFLQKINVLKVRIAFQNRKLNEILKDFQVEMNKSFNLAVQFLLMELETVGNIHFEGLSNNPRQTHRKWPHIFWVDLTCVPQGIEKMESFSYVCNPEEPVQEKQLLQILEDGFQGLEVHTPNLEYFDASHNHVITLEGIRGVSKLQFFNLSWNKLKKSREDINILYKHTPNILSLAITYNPWHKPVSLQLSVTGQLKSPTNLGGVLISNEEAAEALQYIAGSKTTQITVLNLQTLFTVSNLEKSEHLRAFISNDLTQTEGIETCLNLEDLTLDENCISTLDGISKLIKLTRLGVNTNNLISLRSVLENLPYPHYISIENNRILSLVGLKKTYSLIQLYIRNNFVYTNQEIHHLKGLTNLMVFCVSRNRIVWKQDHQLFVLLHHQSFKALGVIAVHLRNVCSMNLQNDNLMSFSGFIFLPNAKVLCLNYNHIESILPGQKLPNQVTSTQELYKVTSHGYGQQGLAKGRTKMFLNPPRIFLTLSSEVELALNFCSLGCRTWRKQKTTLPQIKQGLQYFHLSYNGSTNLDQLQLSRLKNLELLFLQSRCQTEGLEGLQLLQELVLDHNHVMISQSFLARQSGLLTLHLEQYQIQEINNLQPLVKLWKLFLDFNRIQESSELEKLQVIHSLKVLSEHRNTSFPVANSAEDSGFPALSANLTRHNPLRITSENLNENINHLFGSDLTFGHELEKCLLNKSSERKHKQTGLRVPEYLA